MATRFLSDTDLAELSAWPTEVARSDLVAFFDLADADVRWICSHRIEGNHLALAVYVTAIPFLGFVPDLGSIPREIAGHLARQLDADAADLGRYDAQVQDRARQRHIEAAIAQLGWTTAGRGEWKALGDWLVDRALEHDAPSVLFRQALVHLRAERIVRPSLDRLMRAVATARSTAATELYRAMGPLLTEHRRRQLDQMIETDPDRGTAPLVWLTAGATTTSGTAIKAEVAKLEQLRQLGADRIDLWMVNPDRRRHLAVVAPRSTPAAIRRMEPERRYPLLLAALVETYSDIVDQLVLLFDQALATVENRTRRLLRDRQLAAVQSSTRRMELLDDILDVALDSSLDDRTVGRHIRSLGSDRLHNAVRPDHERHQPDDGGHLGLIEDRYTQIRAFAPHVLAALRFHSSVGPSSTLQAVEALVELNRSQQRHVPAETPVDFVTSKWQSYLNPAARAEDPTAFRHHWELAVLYELRARLRSGEIWVEGSRRYANPTTYLLPAETWPYQRPEALTETGRSETFAEQLEAIEAETTRLLDDLEQLINTEDSPVTIDPGGELRLQRLPAETIASDVIDQGEQLAQRLPRVPLAELLIEIDHATGFTEHVTHASHAQPRHPELEHRRNLLAAILAQACNFGITRMAELSGISADTLTWTTRWYLRTCRESLACAGQVVSLRRRSRLWAAHMKPSVTAGSRS